MKTLYIVLFALFIATAAFAQNELADSEAFANKIIFNNEIIDTDSESSENFNETSPDQNLRQYLIHLRRDISEKMRRKLEQDFGGNAEAYYIPHNTFVLIGTKQQAKDAVARNKDAIKWVAEQKHHHKYSEDLYKEIKANKQLVDSLFDVLIIPTRRSEIKDVAKQWQQDLSKIGINAKVSVVSAKKLSVDIADKSKINATLEWLAKHAFAKHIQKKEDFATLEDELTDDPTVLAELDPLGDDYKTLVISEASVLQSQKEKEWIGQPGLPDVQFLWNQGLDGEGEVIGIGDTGLDYYHCAFHDPKGKVPFNKVDLKSHRKIASYWTLADDKDVKHGHGSHVNSIAAGSSEEQPMFDGVARKAKIAFIDIGLPSGLKLPDDLSTDYFPLVYNATPIVSNSWGNRRYGQYTLAAREIDDFAWRHRDFLPLYAAGNSGRSGGATITPPGTAKNALTVGAVQGTYRGFELGLPLYAELLKDQVLAQFCGKSNTLSDTAEICTALTGEANCALSDTVSSEGMCDKIKNTKDCCNHPMMKRFCCTKFMLEKLKKNPHWFNQRNVAVFSSRGPTKDHRLKPELLAHGQPVFGARSYGTTGPHCPIPLVMQGTSQAAPVMAAFATMTRQYYKKGFYPTGKPNKDHGFNPSGALLKATLINSGVNMPGLVDLNGQDQFTQLKPIPSFTQGFGRVSLPNTLPFAGSNFTFFKEEAELSTGESHDFCFTVNSNSDKPFKTTLVWMDYPASPNAALTLVNNLDLTVTAASGKLYYGNGGPDHTNNVEQVMIAPSKSAGQTFKITVKGSKIPHGPQFYALVVSGQMNKVSCSKVEISAKQSVDEEQVQSIKDAKKQEEEVLLEILARILSDKEEL